MLDEVIRGAIEVGQDKMQGEAVEEKQTFKGGVKRFLVTIIWFVITAVVTIGAMFAMVGQGMSDLIGEGGKGLGITAVIASLSVALITFCVPYLRKKGTMTRWFGIVCLGDAIWWIYLLATGI